MSNSKYNIINTQCLPRLAIYIIGISTLIFITLSTFEVLQFYNILLMQCRDLQKKKKSL